MIPSRKFDRYKDVSDNEAELIIDDAMALARLCLDQVQ